MNYRPAHDPAPDRKHPRLTPGQVWRRRHDAAQVVVQEIEPEGLTNRTVTHQGKRVTHTQYDRFLATYELLHEEPLVESLATILRTRRPHPENTTTADEALADAVALVETLGLHEIFTVAWDGEPSMSGAPHAQRIGSEFRSQEQAQTAMDRVPGFRTREGVRVQRRLATAWTDVVTIREGQ